MERFIAHDGVSIAYYTWGEAETGPLVVLHHGFAANAQANWVGAGIVDAFVSAGRRVLAVDARGHGQSDKPHDPAAYGEATMARDLIGLIDKIGAKVYDLVGYSMGAIVSLLVATQDRRIRRLAVGGVGEGVIVCGGVDRRVLPTDAIAVALEGGAGGPAAGAMAAFVDAMGGDRKAMAAQARAAHATPIALDRITVPTLVFAGDVDPLAMRPEVLASAIPGAKLERLSGDHLRALRDPRCKTALLSHVAV